MRTFRDSLVVYSRLLRRGQAVLIIGARGGGKSFACDALIENSSRRVVRVTSIETSLSKMASQFGCDDENQSIISAVQHRAEPLLLVIDDLTVASIAGLDRLECLRRDSDGMLTIVASASPDFLVPDEQASVYGSPFVSRAHKWDLTRCLRVLRNHKLRQRFPSISDEQRHVIVNTFGTNPIAWNSIDASTDRATLDEFMWIASVRARTVYPAEIRKSIRRSLRRSKVCDEVFRRVCDGESEESIRRYTSSADTYLTAEDIFDTLCSFGVLNEDKNPFQALAYEPRLERFQCDYTMPETESDKPLQYVVRLVLETFKHEVEQKGLRVALADGSELRPESVAQAVFGTIARLVSTPLNVAVSAEVDTGRGRVDFKFSRGSSTVLVEMKMSFHNELYRGGRKQLETYNYAEGVETSFYLIVGRESEIDTQRLEQEEQDGIEVFIVITDKLPTASTL